MQSELEMKLVAAKSELQTMMTRSCWRQEWRDAILKWSEKIFILKTKSDELVVFPTEYGGNYYLLLFNLFHTSVSTAKQERNVDNAINYRSERAANYLSVVPWNLFVLVYRHLVLAFGGHFSKSFSDVRNEGYYRKHHLWTGLKDGGNYARHRAIIHDSCQQFSDVRIEKFVESTESNSIDDFDGWEVVMIQGVQLNDKLNASFYILGLLRKLGAHQVHRMIEHHFHWRGKETVKLAKNVADHLRAANVSTSKTSCRKWNIDLEHHDFYVCLLNPEKDRATMKSAKFQSGAFGENSLQNSLPKFAEFLGTLTKEDVAFIVSCFIDALYDAHEMTEKVKQAEQDEQDESNDSKDSKDSIFSTFPSDADDFHNLDFPHLRGLLAETALSRKLAAHAIGLDEIRKIAPGSFASIAPTALTEIVSQYLPVDLLIDLSIDLSIAPETNLTRKRKQ